MHIDPAILALLTGVAAFIPLLTAVITKYEASSSTKARTSAALVLLTGAIQLFVKNSSTGSMTGRAVLGTVFVFLVAGATHSHLWKPTGLTEVFASLFPDFGLGTYMNLEPDPVFSLPDDLLPASASDPSLASSGNYINAGWGYPNPKVPASWPWVTAAEAAEVARPWQSARPPVVDDPEPKSESELATV